jgi:hypothetical protein
MPSLAATSASDLAALEINNLKPAIAAASLLEEKFARRLPTK